MLYAYAIHRTNDSGRYAVPAELVSQMQERVAALLAEEDPKPDWLKVHGMAGLYVGLDADIKSKRAEIDILRPLGLSLSTFISRQHELSTQLVGQINTELIGQMHQIHRKSPV